MPILAIIAALVILPAAPASAHTVGGVGATNFHTTLSALTPAAPGVDLKVIENGSRLELRNTTGTEVTVRGYVDEPYLRIGPDGVYENRQSPAVYLNVGRFAQGSVPAGVDAKNPPDWRKVSTEPVYRWHDHRIHWMLTTMPPAVTADPLAPHRITAWTVTLDQGGRTLVASGSLDWIPGPQPWGWLAVAALLALAVAALGLLRRPYPAVLVATVLVLVTDIAHGAGIALVTPGSVIERTAAFIGGDLMQVTCWLVLVLAVAGLRRGYAVGVWLAAGGASMLALTSGLADLPVLWRSSAPFAWPEPLNRLTLTVTIGIGIGLLAALPILLHRQKRLAPPVVGEPATVEGLSVAAPAETGSAETLAAEEPPSEDPPSEETAQDTAPVSRRRFGELTGAAGLGAVAGAAVGYASRTSTVQPKNQPALVRTGEETVTFHGARQAGIAGPARKQAQVWVGAFDLVDGADTAALRGLLKNWTTAVAALTAGRPVGAEDVGTGLGPSSLTVTVGFGPSLFGKALPVSARPEALEPLPAFAGDQLDPARGDGDLGLVVAADDAMVVQHAVRTLTRLAAPAARPRWGMAGFGRAPGSGADDAATQRNLMGQLDGTGNPKPADPDFDARVFVADGPAWLRGGSYLVVRRIRMFLDPWEALPRAAQEAVIGRRKDTGAPLTGGTEFTPANLGATRPDGALAIAGDAHIRLAAPAFNTGAAMLRKGYSYADGPDDSGLLFLAWQADPRTGFVPVQRRLAEHDALNRFIRHESSALFAMPGGVPDGGYLGQGLLDA